VAFCSIADGALSHRWTDTPGHRLAWSPDGAWLACFGDSLVLIDAATGRQRRELAGHPGFIRTVAWSSDGKRVAACGVEKTITLWDVAEGKVLSQLEGHEGGFPDLGNNVDFRHIAWSPDGKRLASAGADRQVRIWDAATGKLAASSFEPFKAINGPLGRLHWSQDGRHLHVRAGDGSILRLDTSNALAATELVHAGHIDLQIAGNGKVGVLTAANSTYLWSADTGPTRDLGRQFWSARWLPDDRRVVTSYQEFTPYRVYDTQRDEWLGTLYPRLTGEQSVCIGPDGHWRGSEQAAEHLVYVALTEEGQQLTFTPEEFATKYGWKNDPNKARFAALDPGAGTGGPAVGPRP
jgi:WD40 repeat protein